MIGHLLNVTVTVYRGSYAVDGRGGRNKTMAAHGTIRAKVGQPTASERMLAGQRGARLDNVVHVLPTADVQRGDELDTGGARRLRVTSVMEDSHDAYKRLDCQVIEGE